MRQGQRVKSIALGVAAVVFWLFSVLFSLASSLDYTLPVSLALASAVAHFAAVAVMLRRGRSVFRFAWLLLSPPLAVFTLDDLGRLLGILGGPCLRLLI